MAVQDIPLCSWRLGKHSYLCRCDHEPRGSSYDYGFDSDCCYDSECGCEICNGHYDAAVMWSGRVTASLDDGGAGVNENVRSVQQVSVCATCSGREMVIAKPLGRQGQSRPQLKMMFDIAC